MMKSRTKYAAVPQDTSVRRDWYPLPLRFQSLLSFVILCCLLIISLELTIYGCTPDGCPRLGVRAPADLDPTTTSVSTATTFVYDLLPTIIMVLFGLLCAVIHHDCMRMEPWFQLSKSGGVVPEDSLFLEYSYTFLPFIPSMAAKKRHFTVLVSSCMILFTTAVLTPLTAGILQQDTVKVPLEKEVVYSNIPWETTEFDFSDRITSRPYYQAYMNAWFNSTLPAFSTAEYSLERWVPTGIDPSPWPGSNSNMITRPFTESAHSTSSASDQPWTGGTVLYEADLDCEEAIRTPIVFNDSSLVFGYNLTSRRTSHNALLWDPAMIHAYDAQDPPERFLDSHEWIEAESIEIYNRTFKAGPAYHNLAIDPEEGAPDAMVYMWAAGQSSQAGDTSSGMLPSRWTAIFCFPRYSMSRLEATVLIPSGEVVAADRSTATRNEQIPSSYGTIVNGLFREFNRGPQRFRKMDRVYNAPGYVDKNNNLVGLGNLPNLRPNSESQVRKRFGGTIEKPHVKSSLVLSADTISYIDFDSGRNSSAISISPAFALHSQKNETLETLFKPDALAAMHRSAFKLHFAMFCREEWLQQDRSSGNWTDTVITTGLDKSGYRVNRGWCRASEAGIAIIAMMVVWLMVLNWRRPLNLDGEPNSLASALAILHRSGGLTAQLEGSEFQSMTAVKDMLTRAGARYRLLTDPDVGPRIEVSQDVGSSPVVGPYGSKDAEKKNSDWRDNWATSIYAGVFFLSFFVLMTVAIVALSAADKANDGITSPVSRNSFRYKLLFSYIPTLLGIIVKPLLVTLGSRYAMLGPYMPLRRGYAASSNSLSVDYDKSPPHFQIVRCIRSGDLAFGGLTLAIVLANVLTVALSGIFLADTAPAHITLQVENHNDMKLAGNFTGEDMMMTHYTLAASLTGDIKRPNWTTSEYYILPFTTPSTPHHVTNITAATIGLGANVHCSFVPTSDIKSVCNLHTISTTSGCTSAFPMADDDNMMFGDMGRSKQRLNGCKPVHLPKFNLEDISSCSSAVGSEASSNNGSSPLTMTTDPCWPIGDDSKPRYLEWNLPAGDGLVAGPNCSSTLFAAWMEFPAASGDNSGGYLPDPSISILRCNMTHKTVPLTATVDLDGNVLDVKNIEPPVQTDPVVFGNLVATFVTESALSAATWTHTLGFLGLQWYNSHLISIYPEIVPKGRNLTHIPKPEALPDAFEDILRRLYAIGFRSYRKDLILYAQEPKLIKAEAVVTKDKVVLPTTLVAIVMGILGYTTIVIGLLYFGPQAERSVGHSPTCLAAMWAHLYASDAKELCGEIRGSNMKVRLAKLDRAGGRFTYGEFTGKDGNHHVGVFMEPKSAETKSLEDSD